MRALLALALYGAGIAVIARAVFAVGAELPRPPVRDDLRLN